VLTPRHGLVGAAAALALAVAAPVTAVATPTPTPTPSVTVAPPADCGGLEVCVGATAPGRPSSPPPAHKPGKGGGGKPVCAFHGKPVPCTDPNLGVYAGGCYYQLADPQPTSDAAVWQGHKPGDGAIYNTFCLLTAANPAQLPLPGGAVWLARLPGAQAVDPAVLAQRAVDSMRLAGPRIGIVPQPGDRGTVGVPVWMWTAVTPTTWGPKTASAAAGGVTVTATARVASIAWDMGDGSVVRCTTPGTPYEAAHGALLQSPDCGHIYVTPSTGQPHGTYRVRATATWSVPWRGGGRSGVVTVTRTSAVAVAVGEVQVLN
jgi:hypothetical protein